MAGVEKVGNVFVEASESDFSAVVLFYGRLLDAAPQILDEDHGWAQFEVGAVKLCVSHRGAGQPQGNPHGATVSLKTLDLEQWVADARERGMTVATPVRGAHELYVPVRDPADNVVILYAPAGPR
jgi:hypothetical protein